MADIDKDKNKKVLDDPSGEENEPVESFAHASLRDLVLSAGAALSDLGASPVEPAPLKAEADAPPEAGEASEEPAVETAKKKSKKGRGSKKSEEKPDVVESIEWNESTSGLDFVEETRETASETTNPFEELARRVAETVAKKAETDTEAGQESLQAFESELEAEMAPGFESDASADVEEMPASPTEQMGLEDFGQKMEAAEDDSSPEPTEFIEDERLMSVIESLLFATDKPVSVATIKQIFKGSNVRTKDITRALDLLASDYAAGVRGVTLEEINGGFQLRTKSDNAEYLRRLAKVRPFRLSGPSLEVMAIVAYKQPITKHQIDEIRGVESGHLLRALMERGLVCFGEKSDLPGKPMTYGTTRKFLETFGLRNIRELPTLGEIDELLPEGIGDEPEEKETLSDLTDQMSTELTASYSEGEEELNKIAEELKAVDTTSEFFEQEKVRERERKDRERAQDIRERLVLGDAVEDKDKRWLDRY